MLTVRASQNKPRIRKVLFYETTLSPTTYLRPHSSIVQYILTQA